MNWYAAHLVMRVKFKDRIPGEIPVWENIVLIRAASFKAAFKAAARRAKQDEGDCRGSFRWNNRPATWKFVGVRKVVLCVDPQEQPTHGTEVTYQELLIPDESTLKKWMRGKTVSVVFDETFRD